MRHTLCPGTCPPYYLYAHPFLLACALQLLDEVANLLLPRSLRPPLDVSTEVEEHGLVLGGSRGWGIPMGQLLVKEGGGRYGYGQLGELGDVLGEAVIDLVVGRRVLQAEAMSLVQAGAADRMRGLLGPHGQGQLREE